jgi:hypothetical protein
MKILEDCKRVVGATPPPKRTREIEKALIVWRQHRMDEIIPTWRRRKIFRKGRELADSKITSNFISIVSTLFKMFI